MLLLQVSRLVYPWKLFLNMLSETVLSSAAQAWLSDWCGSWTHRHLACSIWPGGKHCCWKHICSGVARPQRGVIKADSRWIGVVWHAAVPTPDFVWSTWVWIMTLITEQYFFICSISLSSCFFPVWSCHFLLYLVKAFFLLLYLEHRKAQIQPRMVAVWPQFTEFTPVFIKSALALVAQVLRKYGFEGTQALDGLDVAHHPDHDDRRGFNDGDCLYFFSFWLLCWHRKLLFARMWQLLIAA